MKNLLLINKKLNRISLLLLLLLLLLFVPQTGAALTKSFNVINFKPAIDDSKYFMTRGSKTLMQWSFRTGFYSDYAYSPLKLNLSGSRSQKLIKQYLVFDVFGSIGLTDFWQIGINVPIVAFDEYIDPITRLKTYRHSLSDIRIETKFRLLDPDKYFVGIALMPFIEIPTGLGDTYVSNGSVTGGGELIVDYIPLDVFSLSLNVGALVRPHFQDQYGANIDDQFLYEFGVVAGPFKKMAFIAEISGKTNLNNFFKNEFQSPLEIRGGMSFDLPHNLIIKAGAGRGIVGSAGDPYFRAFASLSYQHSTKIRAGKLPPAQLPPLYKDNMGIAGLKQLIASYKTNFSIGSYQIHPRYYDRLDEIANVLLKHPEIKMIIEGYACSKGTEERNMILSMLRAISVEKYLLSRGVPQKSLISEGEGSANPVGDNTTNDGRTLNRRVEFKIAPTETIFIYSK